MSPAGGNVSREDFVSQSDTNSELWWFGGRILACDAGGPGLIPGQCSA